ncbi:unnamed protein product [Fasciola hepatica]|uniref:Uncharacterized protein n=1 Tax=Fasciola hepatica TaxID=6192 RepID=A0ABC9HIZ6_FASHE
MRSFFVSCINTTDLTTVQGDNEVQSTNKTLTNTCLSSRLADYFACIGVIQLSSSPLPGKLQQRLDPKEDISAVNQSSALGN